MLRAGFGAARCADADEQRTADDEARRVHRQRHTRAACHDERATHGRAEHPRHVAGQSHERVRLLQPGRAHRVGDQPDLCRPHHGAAGAVERLQHEDRDDRARVGEDERRRRRLRDPLHRARAGQNEIPRQTVGDDAAEQDAGDLHQRPCGEHGTERGSRVAHLEHGEDEGDVGHRVAERRHRRAREEQPELALRERAKTSAESAGHRRIAYAGAVRGPRLVVRGDLERGRPGLRARLQRDAGVHAEPPHVAFHRAHAGAGAAAFASAARRRASDRSSAMPSTWSTSRAAIASSARDRSRRCGPRSRQPTRSGPRRSSSTPARISATGSTPGSNAPCRRCASSWS